MDKSLRDIIDNWRVEVSLSFFVDIIEVES